MITTEWTTTEPEFDIVDHGVDNHRYFQSAGVSYTRWTECFTGFGMSAGEALNHAFEVAYNRLGSPTFAGLTREYLDAVRLQPRVVEMLAETVMDDEIAATIDDESEMELHHWVTLFVLFDKKAGA